MATSEEDKVSTREMTVMTEPIGRKDETYYWSENVELLIEDVLFRIPQYPFHVGSEYFVEKYGLSPGEGGGSSGGVVKLDGVTAAQFQIFLKLLFPLHLTSTTTMFTKAEWLTILTLSTLWHFHDSRKLAIQHLDGHNLTEMELIEVGRATSISGWVLAGFKSIAGRPRGCFISDGEANAIGHRAAHQIWTIRYQLAVDDDDLHSGEDFIERELRSRFSEELAALKTIELEHRTKADIERAEREEEERRELEEEAKAAAEREELAREEAAKEEAERQERERLAEEERLSRAKQLEEERLKEEEEKREEEIRLERERIEKMRHEEELIQKELAELERQEQEAKEAEERRRREMEERVRRRQEIHEREQRELGEAEEKQKQEKEHRRRIRAMEVGEKPGNEPRERQIREERLGELQKNPSLGGLGSLWGERAPSFGPGKSAPSASPESPASESPFGWRGTSVRKMTSSTSLAKPSSPQFDRSGWGGGVMKPNGSQGSSDSPTTPLLQDSQANASYPTSRAPSPVLETLTIAPDYLETSIAPEKDDAWGLPVMKKSLKKKAKKGGLPVKKLDETQTPPEQLRVSPPLNIIPAEMTTRPSFWQ